MTNQRQLGQNLGHEIEFLVGIVEVRSEPYHSTTIGAGNSVVGLNPIQVVRGETVALENDNPRSLTSMVGRT